MAAQRDTGIIRFNAGEALEPWRRVKLNGATVKEVVYADAGEEAIGITQKRTSEDDAVPVKLLANAQGTFKVEASAATTAGGQLYGAADGKVSMTESGAAIFRGLEAASGTGSIIEGVALGGASGGGSALSFDWQESVADELDFTSAEPAAPSVGDRYINTNTGVGSETGQAVTADHIYEADEDGTWIDTTPNEGAALAVEDDNVVKIFNGSAWAAFATYLADESVTLAKLEDLTQGSIISGQGSDRPGELAAKTDKQILVGDGTDVNSVAVSGDIELANTGAVSVAVEAVASDVGRGVPFVIEFRPNAAGTFAYTVPAGKKLRVLSILPCFKTAGNGANADDEVTLKNDTDAITDTKELNGVNDGVIFNFASIDDGYLEVVATETLNVLANENAGNGCDCIIPVVCCWVTP